MYNLCIPVPSLGTLKNNLILITLTKLCIAEILNEVLPAMLQLYQFSEVACNLISNSKKKVNISFVKIRVMQMYQYFVAF